MGSFFLWLVILTASTGLAIRVFEFFKIRFYDVFEKLVLAAAMGLGFLAYMVFLFGSFKLLVPSFFIGLFAFLLAFSARPFLRTVREFTGTVIQNINEGHLFNNVAAGVCLITVLFALAGTLAPAVGQDELCYHLTQPKNYVREHTVYTVPYSTSALWPFLMEMLFTLGILLKGAELAKLFHFAMYLLTGAALYSFLRRFTDKQTAYFGFWVYGLTPAVFIQSSFAYVDNGLACYVFLCFYSLYVFLKESDMKWAALAGIFAGFAVSTKLIGLFILPIIFLAMLFGFIRSGQKKPIGQGIFLFASALFLSGSVWYIRSAVLLGNPVFPFYPDYFGGHGWQDATYVNAHGRGQSFWDFLILLWDITVHPGWFGGEHVGPAYLTFLPLVFFARPLAPAVRYALLGGLGYSVLWFVVDPNIRFFFPALALFSIGAAVAMNFLVTGISRFFKVIFYGVFFAIFLMEASFAVYHFKEEMVLLLRGGRERYLIQKERSYGAAKEINRFLRPSDRILSVGEARGYYFDNPFTLEGDFNNFTNYRQRFASIAELNAFFKKEGFTHILASSLEAETAPAGSGFNLARALKDESLRNDYFKVDLVVTSKDVKYVLYKIL